MIPQELLPYFSRRYNVTDLLPKIPYLPLSYDHLGKLAYLVKNFDFFPRPKAPLNNGIMLISFMADDLAILDSVAQSGFLLQFHPPDPLVIKPTPFYFLSPLIGLYEPRAPKAETYVTEKANIMKLFADPF